VIDTSGWRASVDVDDLHQYLLANLARYKVPERIAVVEALPRNAMGKVVRTDLAGLLIQRIPNRSSTMPNLPSTEP